MIGPLFLHLTCENLLHPVELILNDRLSFLFTDFECWALFEHVVLFSASQAEIEVTLCALTHIFVLIYLCKLSALRNGAPTEVFVHFRDSLINTELIEFLDQSFR
jgi:hypothetical protein